MVPHSPSPTHTHTAHSDASLYPPTYQTARSETKTETHQSPSEKEFPITASQPKEYTMYVKQLVVCQRYLHGNVYYVNK